MDQQPQAPEQTVTPFASDLDMEILIDEWKESKQYTENNTTDAVALLNIVDGVPLTKEEDSPYVGDTKIAQLARQIPRESLQQLPIFAAIINGTKNSVQAYVVSYLLKDTIFNEDTFGKGILSTLLLGAQQAVSIGFAPFMCATGVQFDEFGTSMRLMHYTDVGIEPGVSDASESSYYWVTAPVSKSRLKKIIENAEGNPNTTWNVPALKRLLAMEPESNDKYSIYQSDARKKGNTTSKATKYLFATRYEVGKKGQFVTICPQIEDEALRVLGNKSKFGFPRVQFLVLDPEPLSPFGLSRVRLAAPNHNLMNALYMNTARMLIINSDPPILQRGRFDKPVQLKRRAKWVTRDQNATVELKNLSNDTMQHFQPFSDIIGGQIQNAMGMPTGAISSGASGYSKTAPGVAERTKDAGTAVNQVTNILESFVRQYALVAVDTLMAENVSDDPAQPNIDTIIVDDATKNAINRLFPDTIGDDNSFELNWNELYDYIKTIKIEIELSLGKDELEEKKRGDIQDTLTVMTQNADPNDPAKQAKISEIEDRLLEQTIPESKRMEAPAPAPTTIDMGNQVTRTQ